MRGMAATASSAPWMAAVIGPASSAVPNSEMSAPAAKMRSPPVITTAPGGSARKLTAISCSRRTTPLDRALTFPLASVTIATASSSSSVTKSSLIPPSCVQYAVEHGVGGSPRIRLVGGDRLGQRLPTIAGADLTCTLVEAVGDDLAEFLPGT